MKYTKNVILFSLFAMNLVEQPTLEIQLKQGVLRGKVSTDGTFNEYLGVPYASFNEDTRFKAPLPPPHWDGVYNAVDEMYTCPQLLLFGVVVGSEDCLRTNIYVPVKASSPLPVMAYIHGGSFLNGDSRKLLFGPEFLIKHDVIIVTFNYRLGTIGFLCLGIEEAPGNAGLKDQLAALRWIKDNIAAFGGDPDNITLFGGSAGAVSASIFLATGKADGLFHKAILQSGSSLASWALSREPVKLAGILTKALGYDEKNPHEIYKILSKFSTKELASVNLAKPGSYYMDTDFYFFQPCIEKSFNDSEPFITNLTYNTYPKQNNNIPVITGVSSQESMFLVYFDYNVVLNNGKDGKTKVRLLTTDFEFKDDNESMNVSTKIKNFYFGDDNITWNNSEILVNMTTHLFFTYPSAVETDILLSAPNIPSVYNYWFNYNGNRNYGKILIGLGNKNGASHMDDVGYILKPSIWPFKANPKDAKLIETLTRLWTNFAKYSDPTPVFDHSIPFQWTPSKKDDLKYLYIDDNIEMGPMPMLESFEMWKEIHDKYRGSNLSMYFD